MPQDLAHSLKWIRAAALTLAVLGASAAAPALVLLVTGAVPLPARAAEAADSSGTGRSLDPFPPSSTEAAEPATRGSSSLRLLDSWEETGALQLLRARRRLRRLHGSRLEPRAYDSSLRDRNRGWQDRPRWGSEGVIRAEGRTKSEFFPGLDPGWRPDISGWYRLDRESRAGLGYGATLNRVDGFSFLLSQELRNAGLTPSLRAYEGYGFQSEEWSGAAEVRVHPLHPAISLGARWESETVPWSLPLQAITSDENFVAAFFVRDDFRDYFRRKGSAYFAEWSPYAGQGVQVAYEEETHESLKRGVARWGIFGGRETFSSNPTVDEGDWTMIRARTFWSKGTDDLHWGVKGGQAFLAEATWSGGALGGERHFVRLWAEHRGQFRLTPSQSLGYRLTAGGTPQGSADLEGSRLPKQFRFEAGGVGTLRGHEFQEFRGDRILLGTLEYSVDLGSSPVPVIFFDGGKAWNESQHLSGGVAGSGPLELDGGLGFLFGSDGLRIDIARDLRRDHAPARVTLRMARSY